jgi:beta-lactam-binding protein with PASTA domain
MSDFLKGFSQDNYQETRKKTEQDQAQDKNVTGATGQTPLDRDGDRAKKSIDIPENAREELFEKDPDLEKKRKRKLILIVAGILVGCLVIGLPYYFSRRVKVPNFVESNPEQVQTWALRNNIFVEIEEEFNLEYNRNVVIAQTPAAGETLFKGGSIGIVVSKGPDPDERLELPDFSTMSIYEIEQWIDEYRADNINISRVYDDTVPVNRFIKIEFRDSAVTAENYRRKDRATITISRGPEEFAQDIEVKDFKGKLESEVVSWAETEGIELHIERAYSDTVPDGHVISQSIAPGTMIAKNEEMTITVSQGKAIYVPNFAGLSEEEAGAVAATANVSIQTIQQYHNNVKAGDLISQSIKPGTLLKEGGNTIILYYSLGKPFIPDMTGETREWVEQFFADLNSKKANLKYEFEEAHDGVTPKGTVIFNTHANSMVDTGRTITVTISEGVIITTGNWLGEDFTTDTLQEELTSLKDLGLKIIVEYVDPDPDIDPKPGSGTIIKLKKRSIKDGKVDDVNEGEQINTADYALVFEIAK